MNQKGYELLSNALETYGIEASIYPKPIGDEDVKFFDVVSDEDELSPSKVLNAFRTTEYETFKPNAQLIMAQSHVMTFDDLAVAAFRG